MKLRYASICAAVCSAAFSLGCSAAGNEQPFQPTGVDYGKPGCSTAGDCGSCKDCLSSCMCSAGGDQAACASACGVSGSGGSSGVGGASGGVGGTGGGAGGVGGGSGGVGGGSGGVGGGSG